MPASPEGPRGTAEGGRASATPGERRLLCPGRRVHLLGVLRSDGTPASVSFTKPLLSGTVPASRDPRDKSRGRGPSSGTCLELGRRDGHWGLAGSPGMRRGSRCYDSLNPMVWWPGSFSWRSTRGGRTIAVLPLRP